MVVTHEQIDGQWLVSLNTRYSSADIELIRRACSLAEALYAGKTDLTGASLFGQAKGSANTLIALNMDAKTLCATLLHAVPEYLEHWQEAIESNFGPEIKNLIEGIARLEQVRQFSQMRGAQVETLRKMLLAMVNDIRVVLIKLACRTQTLRSLSGAEPAQQKKIAQETLDLFAPLANRLGVWQIKWELEDLSVRYLDPALYREVSRLLDEKRIDRERYIAGVVQRLKQALDAAGIPAEVTGRPKHIYSIINKMKRKHLKFDELYDVRAVRIQVADIQSCYAALSLVHELWTPLASEYDDYIARPKSNNYRSLHTAVKDTHGLPFEVQIRTHEMHRHSELGVAAHWRYKEGGKSDASLDEKILWLRQILEWQDNLTDKWPEQSALLHDQVYVFTPQGLVIDLPKDATPVDFAYRLHSELGHRTRGAKVNGAIVPLNYRLKTGERVEILAAKQGGPSRDWLTEGYLQSSGARAKVRAWFRNQNLDENTAQGRILFDRELHRLGIHSVNQEKLAHRLKYDGAEQLLAAIGRNEISLHRISSALQESNRQIVKPAQRPATAQHVAKVLIGDIADLPTRTAKCCNPAPPDAIVGYITRDRGITIHRQDCIFLQRTERQERLLAATWGE